MPAKLAVNLSEDKSIDELKTLTATQIRRRLNANDVNYPGVAQRGELSAWWALLTLGLLEDGDVEDPALLEEAKKWCDASFSVKELKKTIRERGLEVEENGYRWDHVKVLILDEVERLGIEKERDAAAAEEVSNENAKGKGKKKTDVEDSTELNVDEDSDVDNSGPEDVVHRPSPEVMNLLLNSIYTEVERSGNLKLLLDCPFITKQELQAIMNQLPLFTEVDQMAGLPATQQTLIDWVSVTFGSLLTPASGDLVVPGFDKSIAQFVVSSPSQKQHGAFQKQLSVAKGKSFLGFHGTPPMNLLSVLQTKFNSADGVWTAEQPTYSYSYAYKMAADPTTTHTKSPYRNCGILYYSAIEAAVWMGNASHFEPESS